MVDDAPSYAALGLEPGADPAAIEEAYKRLIKEHHPDRPGGSADRAAEINRAYRDLRAERNLKDPLELNDELAKPSPAGRTWAALALILAVAAGALLLVGRPLGPSAESLRSAAARRPPDSSAGEGSGDPMDQPLHLAAIGEAAQRAQFLARTRDEMALASASRDCHRALRKDPTLLQLDRCAAFDDAVVQLQNRDPLRDQGPFSEPAVTARLWSGATGLSGDYVAIDGRLDRIRLQVELALASAVQPNAPAGD